MGLGTRTRLVPKQLVPRSAAREAGQLARLQGWERGYGGGSGCGGYPDGVVGDDDAGGGPADVRVGDVEGVRVDTRDGAVSAVCDPDCSVREDGADRLATSAAPLPSVIWPSIGTSLIAIDQGDPEAATENYARLEPHKGVVVMGTYTAVDRTLGLLASSTGQHEKAAAHFEEALAFCKQAGYRPEYAWTASDYSEALIERGRPGDRDRVVSLQDEALTVAGELGMHPLTERVLARREILKA